MNKTTRVGIVGVSGYSGIETARLVSSHPAFTLTSAVSDKWAGAAPGDHPSRGGAAAAMRGRVGEPTGLIIDGASGTTGAGKRATEAFSFSEVDGDFRAYRVLRHQHTPEIERALGLAGHAAGPVTFTPHLLPTRRGILATIYGRLRPGKTGADAAAAVAALVK